MGAFVRARMAWKLLLCTSLFLNEGFSGFPPSFWVSFVRFFLFGSNSLTTSSSACSLADCVREREGPGRKQGQGKKRQPSVEVGRSFHANETKDMDTTTTSGLLSSPEVVAFFSLGALCWAMKGTPLLDDASSKAVEWGEPSIMKYELGIGPEAVCCYCYCCPFSPPTPQCPVVWVVTLMMTTRRPPRHERGQRRGRHERQGEF